MAKPRDLRQKELFRPALERVIDMGHPLVRLAARLDWPALEERVRAVCRARAGGPPLPPRLVAGLIILKHREGLSDRALSARWLENPYYQYFCGEEAFRHTRPFARTSLGAWQRRLGEERLAALLADGLAESGRGKRRARRS